MEFVATRRNEKFSAVIIRERYWHSVHIAICILRKAVQSKSI